MGLLSHEQPVAHEITKGDPRIDGPYLDDYNAAYDDARREGQLIGQDREVPEESDTKVIAETASTITTATTEWKEGMEPVEPEVVSDEVDETEQVVETEQVNDEQY